jgi:hypothetical protein
LILNDETRALASDYERLFRRALDAASNGDLGALGGIGDEVRRLNERAGALLDRSSRASFSGPAEECERLAEDR